MPTDEEMQQSETPMSDHVALFWRLLEEGKVRILIDTECPGFGDVGWYASSSFGNDVAKALVADRVALKAAEQVRNRPLYKSFPPIPDAKK